MDGKLRTLKRGRVYDVRGVETIAVVEVTIRGVRVRYSGEFDIEPAMEVESGQNEKHE